MPLRQDIGEFAEAIRDRVVVSRRGETWRITAGSFDTALAYARARFGDPVVLSRSDRARYWRRVTLEISTDPAQAAFAPPLEELTKPPVNEIPRSLEAIFEHQMASPR